MAYVYYPRIQKLSAYKSIDVTELLGWQSRMRLAICSLACATTQNKESCVLGGSGETLRTETEPCFSRRITSSGSEQASKRAYGPKSLKSIPSRKVAPRITGLSVRFVPG
jgi:hypothetical protein